MEYHTHTHRKTHIQPYTQTHTHRDTSIDTDRQKQRHTDSNIDTHSHMVTPRQRASHTIFEGKPKLWEVVQLLEMRNPTPDLKDYTGNWLSLIIIPHTKESGPPSPPLPYTCR